MKERVRLVSVYYNEGLALGPVARVEELEDGYVCRSHTYRPHPGRVFMLANVIASMANTVWPFLTGSVGYVAEIRTVKEVRNE